MNLIFFLTIISICSIISGEFGKFPFGSVVNSFSILDFFVAITAVFFLIWKFAITKKIDLPKIYLLIIGFIGISFGSLIWNSNFSGILYLIRLSLYSLFFWIGFSLMKWDSGKTEHLKKIIIGAGAISAFLGILQLIIYPDLSFLTTYGYDPHIRRLAGTFLDPNFLGAFLSIVYGLFLIRFLKQRSLSNLLLLLILVISIVLTFSRSAWLMFFIVNLFSIWYLPKKMIAGLIIVLILFGLSIPRVQQRIMGAFEIDISASERLNSWDKGFYLFKQNPVLGIGFNNIRSYSISNGLLKPFTSDGGNSGAGIDSSWLLIFATTGVLGGIMFSYFYFYLVVVFTKYFYLSKDKDFLIVSGILVGYFVNAQFINSLFYPALMLILFLITGVYYAQIKKK
jgi:O-antigen ligase